MEYLKGLNNAQRDAVVYIDGPSMVIAGAGSGKTRVLTHKIVHLIQNGYDPHRILTLTFTNKAANEMRERIEKMIGKAQASALWMGTFHSVFARILRKEAELLGYPRNFTIYDTIDSRNVVKQIVKEKNLDPKAYPANIIHGRISMAKNNLITAEIYDSNPQYKAIDRQKNIPEFSDIFLRYQRKLKQAGAMDFDDLLLNMNILFSKHTDVLEKYQDLFRFILVDEYQDTNYAQYLIVKKLAAKHKKVCVVGDDAQSIYAFRGARIENIFNFQKDFPGFKLFKLEQNYRSTQTIVQAANSVIAKNSKQIKKNVFSENEQGNKILVIEHATEKDEGYWVAQKIKQLHKEDGVSYDEIAILYRMNAQSRIFEDYLRKFDIPYKVYGGMSFYQRKEIKDVIAYLRLVINPKDDEALRRVFNYPTRGIGETSQKALFEYAAAQGKSIWEVLTNLETLPVKVNPRAAKQMLRFREMIRHFAEQLDRMTVYDFVNYVVKKSGLLEELEKDKTIEGESRRQNIEELVNAVKEYAETEPEEGEEPRSLEDFLAQIALLTSEDNDTEQLERIKIMTVHSAKGLEFHTVFLVGLEEGIFPGMNSKANPKELEEERRLFYVALTRAMRNLFISYARMRRHWGKIMTQSPSSFIAEIDPRLIEYNIPGGKDNEVEWKGSATGISYDEFRHEINIPQPKRNLKKVGTKKKTEVKTQPQKKYDEHTGLKVGDLVEHKKFGKGRVVALSGEYPDTKAEIEFANFGKKQLLLKFAKLQILS